MRKTCLNVLKVMIVGVLIFSTTFGNLNRSFSFTSHNDIIVQAEDISTAEKEGLAALITWLLANGMRFASDSADAVYQGVNNLWNNFKTASGTAATLAGLTTYITFKNGKTRFQEGFATIANAFQKYIMDAYYLDYGSSETFEYSYSVGDGNINYIQLEPNTCITMSNQFNGWKYFMVQVDQPVR